MARYINADKAIETITEVIHDTVLVDWDVVADEAESELIRIIDNLYWR